VAGAVPHTAPVIEPGHDPASWLFAAIAWAWQRRIRDGAIPLSPGERARRRLLVR
jgi:hypothetical protein